MRRIDYIVCNDILLEKVISTNNIDIPFTDHKGVFVDASYNIVTKGKGFLKFNNTMLKNKEYGM